MVRMIDWILSEGDFPVPLLQFSFRQPFGNVNKSDRAWVKKEWPNYT